MKFARHFFRSAIGPAAFILAATTPFAAPATEPPPPAPARIDLQTAIGYALEHNFAIRQARERIREQEGVVVEVKAQALPNVGAGGNYQFGEREISNSQPQSNHGWSLNLTASQTLFAGGGVRASIQSSELVREAALLDLKAVINAALLQVRTNYYQVLLARERITVQEENLRLLEQQLKTTTDRFEAGTVSGFERLRAEVAVANAKTPLISARNDYRLAIEALRQSLGLTTRRTESLDSAAEIVGKLDFEPVSFDLRSATESARANRPDLQRLSKLVAASERAITTARSGYYPRVAAVGGWEAFKGRTLAVSDGREGAFIGVQSQWDIFDGRATSGRVAQARSVVEQNRLTLVERELAAEVEVRRAYSSWQEATELVEASGRVVEQAEEAVRLANARYSAGTGTQLDVLQAQVELTTARTNQVQAYYNYNVAIATLRQAMGLTDALVQG
ncbi:TolC family protein [Opitutus terrae]|uniref:Outer membrane efflux protein n=1 Tax=Opitutus terrae (strain DSM 11246 / JCM 15787 / PB90-1) TaxID=452637 RepID=B1ZYH8_OPITP|nr:TolC family protein [Opitutus terrae]ACB77076.1 outer membrane efflux protein [Opitutus terrae PB90-1]